MISPYRVEYATYSSLDFDLICDVAFDSDSGATSSFLSREAVASETYRGAIKRVSSYKYTESFAPVITFVDKNFGDFTMQRQRQILKWLTSKDTPSFLNIYHDDSLDVAYSILGAFTECETYKLGNGRVVGFQCTFESVMPYALSGLESMTKTASTNHFETITINTDDNQPIYPRVTIQQKGTIVQIPAGTTYDIHTDMVPNTVYYNGSKYYWKTAVSSKVSSKTRPNYSFTLVPVDHAYNATTDTWESGVLYYYPTTATYYWLDPNSFHEETTDPTLDTTSVRIRNKYADDTLPPIVIKNNMGDEKIVLDGANRVAYSSNTKRILGDDFVDWRWLELYDGDNDITVEGNCEVTLEWRTVVKCGEY